MQETPLKIADNNVWIDQRKMINPETQKAEPHNWCMISSFSSWILQFGRTFKIPKWDQFHEESLPMTWWILVMNRVRNTRENDNRFMSNVHRDIVNKLLEHTEWKMITTGIDIAKIKEIIDSNQSLVVGTNISSFMGGATGHIQNWVGYNNNGIFSNDPYGWARDSYRTKNGKNVFYSWNEVNRLTSDFKGGQKCLMSYAVKK